MNTGNTHARFAKPGRKPHPQNAGTTIEPGSGANNEVPEMPPAAMYGLTRVDEQEMELAPLDEWPQACQRVWQMIWTSELASSYVDSDRLQAETGSSPREWCICPFDKTGSMTISGTGTSPVLRLAHATS